MKEPIYEFIRGKGWIVPQTEYCTFTYEGTPWLMEHRQPKVGECFEFVFKGDKPWTREDDPTKPVFSCFIEHVTKTGMRAWRDVQLRYSPNAVYVTLTPL